MKYRIVTIADIHWGVMDAQKQYDEFMLVLLFLQTIDRVDLVCRKQGIWESKAEAFL
jgi:hypothetical protein